MKVEPHGRKKMTQEADPEDGEARTRPEKDGDGQLRRKQTAQATEEVRDLKLNKGGISRNGKGAVIRMEAMGPMTRLGAEQHIVRQENTE